MIKTNAIVKNVEIRGCQKKKSQKGVDYLVILCDDEQGNRSEFMDKDLEREPYYKRGAVGDFTLKLNIGKYANVEVIDFQITEKE